MVVVSFQLSQYQIYSSLSRSSSHLFGSFKSMPSVRTPVHAHSQSLTLAGAKAFGQFGASLMDGMRESYANIEEIKF